MGLHPRIFLAALIPTVCVTCLVACSQPVRPLLPPNAPASSVSLHPYKLSGVIEKPSWTVKAGDTAEVTGNLAVFASDVIEVDGTLQVEKPGIRVALYSPRIIFKGMFTQSQASSSAPRTKAPKVFDVLDGCQIDIENPPGGDFEIPSGDDLVMVTEFDVCEINIGKPVRALPGASGDDKVPALFDGQPGGSIYIGTALAKSVAEHVARGYGHHENAESPGKLNFTAMGASIAAGNGGSETITPSGTLKSGAIYFTGQSGGKGGSVAIDVGEIADAKHVQAVVAAGNGGNGGALISGSVLDGSALHPNGWDGIVTEGSGGDGGSIADSSKVVAATVHFNAGSGGNPGNLAGGNYGGAFLGGNGIVGPPPGSGGSVTVTLGNDGYAGSGAKNASRAAANGAYPLLSFSNSDGGTGPLYSSSFPGGNGGSLTINGSPDKKPLPAGTIFQADGFGYGGLGQSPCGTNGGAAGGNGGNLTLGATVPFAQIQILSTAFDGGAGGFGNPSGPGGNAGTLTNTGQTIGTAGKPGATC